MSKKIFCILSTVLLLTSCVSDEYKSSRGERETIAEGNRNYEDKNFPAAAECYEKAIGYVPGSLPAHFNSTLSQLRNTLSLTDSLRESGLDKVYGRFDSIAESVPASSVASMSYYNMGNLMFSRENIDESIELYKKALRINPADSLARRNLRIAQLNRKPQDKNNNGGGNDNNEDKNKDQNKPQDNKQQDNQEKKEDQQPQNQQPQQQQPAQPQQLNQGAGDRILQRSQNKENEVRRQMYKNAARQDVSKQHRVKNW